MFKNFYGFHLLEAHQKMRHELRNKEKKGLKKSVEAAIVIFVTLLLWNLPATSFGIEGLTVVQQRIIAIFAFATLMWVMEVVPSWATSVAIIGLMLLFTSDSGIKWLCNPDEVGDLLSYKGVMACFADPVIMLFIGGFILAIAATKTGLDAQLAKVLPISTPPNALAYATNLVEQKQMARIGIIVGIISMSLGYALLYLLGSLHTI